MSKSDQQPKQNDPRRWYTGARKVVDPKRAEEESFVDSGAL